MNTGKIDPKGRDSRLSRRDLLRRAGWVTVLGPVILSCKKSPPISCVLVDSLSREARATRESLEYVDASPKRDKTCETCTQWVPPTEDGACGGCKVMKGPAHPLGYCRVYAKAG